MRNSKVKGFTLIELIVVIAIIGVLAAILVPSMIGFIETSRISRANANAKTLFTATASALTQASVDGVALTEDVDDPPKVDDDKVVSTAGVDRDVTCKDKKTTIAIKVNGNDDLDLTRYIGETFSGVGKVNVKLSSFSVCYALWGQNSTQLPKDAGQITAEAQKGSATIYGCYPLANDPVVDDSGDKGEG